MKIGTYKEKYKIAVIQESIITWIEQAVTSLSWNGSTSEASRTLNMECLKVDGKTDIPLGSAIIIYSAANNKNEKQELMRYILTKKSKTRSSTTIKYTARDIRWWLTRSKIDRKFENMTASSILLDICKSVGIDTGEVQDTKEIFGCLHFIKKSPWDIIITALTETRKKNGKKFTVKVNNGKLDLVEKLTQAKKWVIEEGVNLIDATYDEDIESIYTQVKVNGKDEDGNEISAVSKNEEKAKLYGIMQEQVDQSESITQEDANRIAAQKLKELSELKRGGTIKTLGIDDIQSGDAVYVVDKETGLIGGFYIESDSHKYCNGYHEMSLTLSWTDDLPQIEYEAPKEDKEKEE